MANAQGPTSFAALLRQYRLAAGLTQEALAERAGMSVRGIQNLEGGVSRPYRESARRLAAALGLTDEDQAAFLAAAQPAPRQIRPAVSGQAGQVRHNLPLQLTSFVGRERELAEVKAALGRARLVTLTGTGGCGKTRLALELAAAVMDHYPDGVWLVELAPLADPATVVATVASVVGVREQPGQPLVSTLVSALRPKQLLLLLDNCEHLLDACARLADALLRGCADVHLLATSRQSLGMVGEIVFRVPALALAGSDHPVQMDALRRCDAVQLFCDRASVAQPGFTLTAQNAEAVAQLCRQLDGLPLALELAAAQMRWLGIRQLAERLDERFHLLTQGNRAALPRQQTLRAAVDWSYGLLDDAERRLFARVSVFAGGWTLEAAEAVCAGDGVAREAVPELLARLVERSLVQAEEQSDGGERYRLLETLRQYGRERLLASGEADAVAGRHAAFYLARTQEAEPQLRGPQQVAWQRRLALELDNLRAALRWWLEHADAERGLRMVVALKTFWYRYGFWTEALGWMTALLALPDVSQNSLHGIALHMLGAYTRWQGDTPRGDALVREALAILRAAGDRHGEAGSLAELAMSAMQQGDYIASVGLYEDSLTIVRELGEASQVADRLLWMGRALTCGGEAERGRACLGEALAAFQRVGDTYGIALTTEFLGEAMEAVGDDREAQTRYTEALALYHEVGDQPGIGTVNTYLGRVALQRGDQEEARRRFRAGLRVAREIGFRLRLCDALEGLAALAAAEDRPERALRLAGAAAALRVAANLAAPPHERAWLAERLAPARQALGEQGAMAAWTEGKMLPLDEAVAEALQ